MKREYPGAGERGEHDQSPAIVLRVVNSYCILIGGSVRQPEAIIQNQIMSYLKFKGIFAWQNKSTGTFDPTSKRFRKPGLWFMRGTSDILGILDGGKLLAIEVKTPKGKLTPEQKLFLREIRLRGGISLVARSVADVELALKQHRGTIEGDVSTT